jgi:hypothetical protein
MKMGIETRNRVDLAYGHVDSRRQLPQLVGGQIPKLLLDRPELVKQGGIIPLAHDADFADF